MDGRDEILATSFTRTETGHLIEDLQLVAGEDGLIILVKATGNGCKSECRVISINRIALNRLLINFGTQTEAAMNGEKLSPLNNGLPAIAQHRIDALDGPSSKV
jgi:hypothetical protein